MQRNNFYVNKQILFYIICGLTILGVLIGSIAANMLDINGLLNIAYLTDNFFYSLVLHTSNSKIVIIDSIVRYGRVVVILWLSGLFLPGVFINLLLISTNGFFYGFTTAFLLRTYGLQGLSFSAIAMLPQNLLMIPAYVFISTISLEYILDKHNLLSVNGLTNIHRKKIVPRQKQTLQSTEFFTTLFIGLACTLLAASVECFIMPEIVRDVVAGFISQ